MFAFLELCSFGKDEREAELLRALGGTQLLEDLDPTPYRRDQRVGVDVGFGDEEVLVSKRFGAVIVSRRQPDFDPALQRNRVRGRSRQLDRGQGVLRREEVARALQREVDRLVPLSA